MKFTSKLLEMFFTEHFDFPILIFVKYNIKMIYSRIQKTKVNTVRRLLKMFEMFDSHIFKDNTFQDVPIFVLDFL